MLILLKKLLYNKLLIIFDSPICKYGDQNS